MIAVISTVFPETYHMQCLYHLYQNLPKNFRSCLESPLYQEFLKNFRAIQRSHCESVFECRSAGIVEKYKAGKKYITTMLLNKKHTWVKCFTSRHFTVETQFTQRVESENALIQKAVQSNIDIDAHYKQMYQSVYYRTHQVPFSKISASDDNSFEPFFDKEVDNSIKTPIEVDKDQEFDLKSLISMVNSDDILEI
ncbi:hypothetical protein C1646_777662 [Rhizophagus diaphanus]|nr:hypothetical protein C1646_777662 [Rhizophagus diaphanus] [Rhizophagus sp. MUCL 43196]